MLTWSLTWRHFWEFYPQDGGIDTERNYACVTLCKRRCRRRRECDVIRLRRFITMFPTGGATTNFDLRTLRAVRVLRPLKLVSGVPSLSRTLFPLVLSPVFHWILLKLYLLRFALDFADLLWTWCRHRSTDRSNGLWAFVQSVLAFSIQ